MDSEGLPHIFSNSHFGLFVGRAGGAQKGQKFRRYVVYRVLDDVLHGVIAHNLQDWNADLQLF